MEADGSPLISQCSVAAFDVDKTLTHRDCVGPFFRQISSWRIVPRFLWLALPVAWAGVRRDRDQLKALATRITMNGLTRDQLEDHGKVFAQRVVTTWMRDDTVQRLQWHLDQGHHIVLVSASYSMYLRHLGSQLGVSDVLACEVSFDQRGRCTGQLIQGNCRGPEKERRLTSWMKDRGLEGAEIYAYGDSAGDDQLLAMATWPTRVGSEVLDPTPAFSKTARSATNVLNIHDQEGKPR